MLQTRLFLAFIVLLAFFISSCKERSSYMPEKNNASLAALKFSEGLKLEEEFNAEAFEYHLNITPQAEMQSQFNGFFVICIPDNPSSKVTISVAGKVKVKEIDQEIPFNEELPIPFVPLRLKLKTSKLLPKLPNIPGTTGKAFFYNNQVHPFDILQLPSLDPNDPNMPIPPIDPNDPNIPKPPLDPNDPNFPKLPFDPNDLNLPDLPIDPNDPNFPDISKLLPKIQDLPEYILIELSSFELGITVSSPDGSKMSYKVHGKVER